jgi:DNA-binding CsgD family transcriptional regulator
MVRDGLSLVLTEAGFTVLREPTQGDTDTIVVIEFGDCKDAERMSGHLSRGMKVVALTSEGDSLEVERDQIEPLSGVLTYNLSVDAVVQSLLLIHAGQQVLPHNLALPRASPSPLPEHQPKGVRLSPREKEILSYVVSGQSNKAIAKHLNVTGNKIKNHIARLLRKIRAGNRTQGAIWALANLPELSSTRAALPAEPVWIPDGRSRLPCTTVGSRQGHGPSETRNDESVAA